MASKVINLDELINDSIKIEFGDECPFCEGDDKFVNTPDSDFTAHIVEKHKPNYVKILGQINPEEGT